MSVIDAAFFDKKFSASRHLLHLVAAAGASDERRAQQLERVRQLRRVADAQIDGVIDSSFANFNSSLASFAVISRQLQDTRDAIQQVSKRAADGKTILSAKNKNLRELLLQQREAQQVVALIRDIESIEAAPAQIHVLLGQRQFAEAVRAFADALDLVFSEQLVGFHAMTGLRDALMECKQTIEERLVRELTRAIYLQSAFANVAARTNQYSLPAIEQELLRSDLQLDREFHRLLDQAAAKSSSAPVPAPSGTTTMSPSRTSTNVLLTAVDAIKRLHREREAIGALKSAMEHELDVVVAEVTRLCRAVFNAGSCTSFGSGFSSETFGSHVQSADFGAFLRLLFGVLRRVAQRHFLVAAYFDADGERRNYGMQEVATTISGVLERVVGEYLEDAATLKPPAHAELDPASASFETGKLFKLSRNKAKKGKRLASHRDGKADRSNQDDDPRMAARHHRVCDPSVFHLPEVYEDLERMAQDLQRLFLASDAHNVPVTSSPAPHSGFGAFLKAFLVHKWVPKVQAKAQHFLTLKTRSAAVVCRLPTPSDTSYQPPNVDNLLFVTDRVCDLMAKMPTHAAELAAVLDAAVRSWLDDCAAIVRDIREPTLNHQQQSRSDSHADLLAAFHEYEGYRRAKQGSPIPFGDSMVQPSSSSNSKTHRKSPEETIMTLELELERELYDPDAWVQGTQGLLMDNARVAMLGYVNSACDLVAERLVGVAGGASGSSSPLATTLHASSRKCSALADECLLFLRREVRLHCCFYLTQLVSQRFDLSEDAVTMAQDAVLGLNLNLSAIESALQPYLATDKMALAFDGVDALLARLLIGNLSQMRDCTFTRGGVQQMLLNIAALRQGLTGTLYSYPPVGGSGGASLSCSSSSCSSSSRLEHAKRFFQLLSLSETQLEVFLLANRGAYAPEAFRALWHVNAPHRPLSQGSVNKLDSLLR